MSALDQARAWLHAHGADDAVIAKHRLAPTTPDEAARRLKMIQDLIEIHQAFAHIDHVFLKGTTLSQLLYGEPTRRAGKDIDVWVGDLPAAQRVLAGLGYEPSYGPSDNRQMQRIANADVRQRGWTQVELHWQPMGAGRMPKELEAALWRERGTVAIAGHDLPVPSGPSYLLYLVLHGTISAWSRLHWLCDVAQWLQECPDDVAPMLERAHALGLERHVDLAYRLMDGVFPVERPPGLARHDHGAWPRRIQDKWLVPEGDSPWHPLKEARFRLAYRTQTAPVVLFYRFVHPTRAEHDLVRLPRPLHVLYYPVRVLRVAGKMAASAIRR